jgi:hypothetical protein
MAIVGARYKTALWVAQCRGGKMELEMTTTSNAEIAEDFIHLVQVVGARH